MKKLLLAPLLLAGCAKTYYYAAFDDIRPRPAARAAAADSAAAPGASAVRQDTVHHLLWWMKSERGYQTDTSMPTAFLSTCPPWGIQPEAARFEVQRGDTLLVSRRNEGLKQYVTAVVSPRGDTVCGEILTPAGELLRGSGSLRFYYGCRYRFPDPLMAHLATIPEPVTLPVRRFKTRKTLQKACDELPREKRVVLEAGSPAEPTRGMSPSAAP